MDFRNSNNFMTTFHTFAVHSSQAWAIKILNATLPQNLMTKCWKPTKLQRGFDSMIDQTSQFLLFVKDQQCQRRNQICSLYQTELLRQFLIIIISNLIVQMCKITFSNVFGQNSLRKGLFEMSHHSLFPKIFQAKQNKDSNKSTQESTEKDLQKIIQTQIFDWFAKKSISTGNPEELIYKNNQKQKQIIFTKKVEIYRSFGHKMQSNNNLLTRRTERLLEVMILNHESPEFSYLSLCQI